MKYFFISFTLYPAYSTVGRGNLHSVYHFSCQLRGGTQRRGLHYLFIVMNLPINTKTASAIDMKKVNYTYALSSKNGHSHEIIPTFDLNCVN